MLINLLLLLVGFVFLIKGADYLIDGAVAISRKFGVSELFIGLTVVAFGTSAPELAVSIQAALKGSGIAIGNVLGSNIANIALILGVTALLATINVGKSTIRIELPFVIIISVAAGMLLLRNNSGLTRYDGIVLLCFLVIYFAYLYVMARRDRAVQSDKYEAKALSLMERKQWLAWLAAVGGIVAVVFGGDLVVRAGVSIAKIFGVSDTLIGVTIVAIGTSLPELVTSAMAGLKKKTDLAVGNIVGSNIFNLLLILGVSSLISPISADRSINQDVYFVIGISVLLLLLVLKNRKLKKFSGITLLGSYAIYIVMSIMIG